MEIIFWIVAAGGAALLFLLVIVALNSRRTVRTTDDNDSYYTSYSTVDVAIRSFGPSKLGVIKAVIEATGMGLRDAKHVVESRGIIHSVPENAAETLVNEVYRLGGYAEIL